jgi:hypothetical protein
MLKVRERWLMKQSLSDDLRPGPQYFFITHDNASIFLIESVFFLLMYTLRFFIETISDHQALTYDLLQESELARVIKDIFHALRDEGTIQCKINDWITLSLSLKVRDEFVCVREKWSSQ